MRLGSIKTDLEKQEKGVWVNLPEGLKLLIARAGNAKCKEMTNRLHKPLRKQIAKDMVSDDVLSDIAKKVVARYILLDWKNLLDEKGKEIKYSEEKAYEIISDPENDLFYTWVLEAASEEQNFRKQSMEDELGNLPAA